MLFFVLRMSFWVWARRLGGLGLVLLGLVDNSPVPLPGSMDALTMVLATQERAWWPYYAAMAVLGSLIGAYMAYALGAEGSKELLEKKLPKKKAEKIYDQFQKHGFWALFIPALLPPPMPFSPFPIAAGVLKYNRRDFFLAVGLARSIRYALLAYLGSRYSEQILGFFSAYYMTLLWVVVGVAVAGVVAFLIWRKKNASQARRGKDAEVKAA
jgi:membrane protein DedA with SNARE-associated domain